MKEDIISIIDDFEMLCYTGKGDEAITKLESMLGNIANIAEGNSLLTKLLDRFASALEKKDFVLGADYLEYGLKPALEGKDISNLLNYFDADFISDVEEKEFYVSSFDEELCLCARNDEGKLIRFNSLFSPEHEASIVKSSLKMKMTTPAVCLFGIGTGLLADKILSSLSGNGKLIIYEPTDRIIKYCTQCKEKDDCANEELYVAERIEKIINDERVFLFSPLSTKKLFSVVLSEVLDFKDLSGLIIHISSGYDRYDSKKCLDFIRSIEDFRRVTITNRNTLIRFQNEYLELSFKNLWIARKMNLARELSKVIPQDIPCIIVAAGPSLSKNINVLKQAKGHALILAVDSAIEFLVKNDVIPDLTITVDPIKPAKCYNDENVLKVPCIVDPNANSDIITKLKGRIFVLAYNEYFNSLLESVGKSFDLDHIGGGSVATVAFALLHNIGVKKLVLVGQDLASSAGKTHAGDLQDGSEGSMPIEGIDGNIVYTRSDWFNYLKWYETYIEIIKKENKDIAVIDATEGGAKIQGTDIMTLKEVLDSCRDDKGELPIFDFGKKLEKMDYYLNENEYKDFCKNHKTNVSKLHEIVIKSEDVVRMCESLINGIEDGTVSDSYISKEKKKINKIHEFYMNNPMHGIINNYLEGSVVSTVSHLILAEGNKTETKINGIKLIQVSFENIAKVAKILNENAKKYEYLLSE